MTEREDTKVRLMSRRGHSVNVDRGLYNGILGALDELSSEGYEGRNIYKDVANLSGVTKELVRAVVDKNDRVEKYKANRRHGSSISE